MVAYDAVTIGWRVLWFVAAVAILRLRRRHRGGARQRDGLLHVEALGDEHCPEAEFLGTSALGDQVAWVLRTTGQRVEAELGEAGSGVHTPTSPGCVIA